VLVAVKWTEGSSDVVRRAQSMLDQLQRHQDDLASTADKLYFSHLEVTRDLTRLPELPVELAGAILTTGGTERPRAITAIGEELSPPEAPEVKEALARLNHVVRGRMLRSRGVDRYHLAVIDNGQLRVRVDHEFEAWLTCEDDESDTPWRILSLKVLVESTEGRTVSQEHSFQLLRLLQVTQHAL